MKVKDMNKFRDNIINMYMNGRTIKYIAEKLDVYPQVVSFMIASAGLSTKQAVSVKMED